MPDHPADVPFSSRIFKLNYAPRSEEKIQPEVVDSKRQWIYEKINHPQKYQDLPHPPGKELVSGESALYLGRHNTASSWLIRIYPRFSLPIVSLFLLLKEKSEKRPCGNGISAEPEKKIVPRVKHHTRELGVDFAEVKIVDNCYRWGSCTVNNNVNFNWRLIKAPMFVIDYVIIHELAHLIEPNHTPRFWNIIRAQSPTMEKAKVWLKENGQLLEQMI
ncbi:putative metal-dependent hydrolase [Methanosarcina sp. MTP4]|uniref:M48 family metallopeptidase n=1 Tax=Methanosarcina sp. MTP4 TaxID=1434100 RepID=UPI000615D0F4|nr:M48 family metallopeptidase [Methanosarcina sp. MTP4]AKB26293.1 putative metal-dependent hydrolase [Methanosarcina sp. MTP4]